MISFKKYSIFSIKLFFNEVIILLTYLEINSSEILYSIFYIFKRFFVNMLMEFSKFILNWFSSKYLWPWCYPNIPHL